MDCFAFFFSFQLFNTDMQYLRHWLLSFELKNSVFKHCKKFVFQ